LLRQKSDGIRIRYLKLVLVLIIARTYRYSLQLLPESRLLGLGSGASRFSSIWWALQYCALGAISNHFALVEMRQIPMISLRSRRTCWWL